MHVPAMTLLLFTSLLLCLHSRGSAREMPRKERKQQDSGFWVEYLAWQPRALLFHNFLTAEECQHLIDEAEPYMEKSSVVDNETGKSKLDQVRTSSGMFLTRAQDEIIGRIEDRIALHTMIPAQNGEGLQVLRYNHNERYMSHYDYFHDEVNTANGGQRIATMLMYLDTVPDGGETTFPDSVEKPNVGDPEFSPCAQAGVAVKPQKGDALFFYSMTPDTALDKHSLHGGCPVAKGTKWSATKWMRVGEYKI